MCGIAGLFDPRQSFDIKQRQQIVSRFCDLQKYRGPDASGLWENEKCTLGHRRLSIIDIDERSNQPMVSQTERYVLSFNGEIYNYTSLRNQLIALGCEFKTDSDTEVLIEGFAIWNEGVFSKIDGMFACAIYDTQAHTVFLVRDRMGEKPLYYSNTEGAISFCSELKPLTTMPGLSLRVSDASLFEYMALRYVSDPNTIFSTIKCVQPGTILKVDLSGSMTEISYFSFDIESRTQRESYDVMSYMEQLEDAFVESVKTRLVADVPVGAFLSSGVDSSLVCSVAAKKLGSHVKCFSAGFVGGTDNETVTARKIAQHLDLPFEEYLVSPDDMIKTASNFGSLIDEPNGDRSCVPTYFLSRLIKTQVTVAVSGDGGDELFGGYGRYGPLNFPGNEKQEGNLQKNNRDNVRFKDRESDAVLHYLQERLPVFPMKNLAEVLPDEFGIFKQRVASRFTTVFARQDLEDIERMRLIDSYSYLPGAVLAKVDRMSMKHSLEVRTPFFSPDILSLSKKLPMALCANGALLKVALRQLLARYLPSDLIRPGKQGFGMPVSFFSTYSNIFNELSLYSDEILRQWEPFATRPDVFVKLQAMARSNINSLWAWIVLGQWVESLE